MTQYIIYIVLMFIDVSDNGVNKYMLIQFYDIYLILLD